jgi:hypothetical protein
MHLPRLERDLAIGVERRLNNPAPLKIKRAREDGMEYCDPDVFDWIIQGICTAAALCALVVVWRW